MNSINAYDDGLNMTGLWFNPHTGDSFEVRDCFYDESNNAMIFTKDGRQLSYADIESYVQAEHPEDIKMIQRQIAEQKRMQMASQHESSALPIEVQSILQNEFSDDDPGLQPAARNMFQAPPVAHTVTTYAPAPEPAPVVATVMTREDQDKIMVERILERAPMPSVSVVVTWAKKPFKQVEMLCELMGVTPAQIAEHYISKIGAGELREAAVDAVREDIMKMLPPEDKCADYEGATAEQQEAAAKVPHKPVKKPVKAAKK